MALPAMHPRQLHILVHDSGKVFTSLTSHSLPATIPDQSLPNEEDDMKMLTTQWPRKWPSDHATVRTRSSAFVIYWLIVLLALILDPPLTSDLINIIPLRKMFSDGWGGTLRLVTDHSSNHFSHSMVGEWAIIAWCAGAGRAKSRRFVSSTDETWSLLITFCHQRKC
jgi:hypothetical protein